MKILSVGNSFSQDAQRYLKKIADANNTDIKSVNLYIGGCTLKRHYLNMLDDEKAYSFEFNGENTGICVSAKDALKSDNWDIVTIQQASHESADFDNYIPYIDFAAEYIRKYSPKSKLFIHQTWGYETGSERIASVGFDSTEQMFSAVSAAYRTAYERIKADGIIKSGDAMCEYYKKAPRKVYRDTFHASYGTGRYLLALVWYKTLFAKMPENHIKGFDVPVSEKDIAEIESIVKTIN